MKKKTKALIGVVAATSLTIAVVSMIFSGNPVADATGASFNGIGNIIKNATKETPFTVVELVPDEKMAKFGYFIEGSEPENWQSEIAKLDTKEKRMAYMSALKDKLNSISADDSTKPLTYDEYKEAYSLDDVSPDDETKYTSFELTTPIELKKEQVVGYKMVNLNGGSFRLDATYKEQIGGDYDENVTDYLFSNDIDGKYAVKFKKAIPENFVNNKIYRANEIRKLSGIDEMKVLGNTRYIYRCPKNESGPAVEYQFALSNKTVEGYAFDNENYDYVLLSFEKIDAGSLSEDEKTNNVYYVVESAEYTNNEAEYSGILSTTEPYKQVETGKGHFTMTTADSYVFVGKGLGNKKLVEATDGKLDHDLILRKVFYTGGFKNNNWFEHGVFLKNFSDGVYISPGDQNYNSESMKFNVITLTPGGINAKINANSNFLSDVGLLYISASSSLVNDSGLKSYGNNNDINTNVLDKIKSELNTRNLPILVEYSNDTYNSTTNFKSLIKEIVEDRNNVDKDADGHFVNKSIYIINKDDDEGPFIFDEFASDFVNKKSSESEFVKRAEEEGFVEVAESIIEENTIVDKGIVGTTDNTEKFALEISKARSLEYIISFNNKRKKTTEGKIKILDIEPAKVVGEKTVDSDRMNNKIASWFSANGQTIDNTSVTIPTTEFIGRNDDLSDYDVIYMGLDISSLNKTSSRYVATEVVPEQHVPSTLIAGEWLTGKRALRKIPAKTVNQQVIRLEGTNHTYTIPKYTIPAYEIPAATTYQIKENRRKYYWRPAYQYPAYIIPSYTRYVWKGASETTVYNDSKMNGLIYSNIGDIFYSKVTLYFLSKAGILDTDYLNNNNNIEAYKDADPNTDGIKINYRQGLREEDYHKGTTYQNKSKTSDISYRFAGNDITKEKLNKLKDFINSGYPIVFASGFVNQTGSGISVNSTTIDNSSRMYELIDYAINFRNNNPTKKNVLFETEQANLNNNDLTSLIDNINLPKPQIELEVQRYEPDLDDKRIQTDYTKINNRTLEISFKLRNKGFESENARFNVSLYIDNNADGKFSSTKEVIKRADFDLFKNNVIHKGDLTASSTDWYKVTYRLPDSYIGVIPWKVQVDLINNNGASRYSSKSGFGYVEHTGTKPRINILQIKSAGMIKSPYNQYFKNDQDRYKYNYNFLFNHLNANGGEISKTYNWPTLNNFDMASNRGLFPQLLSKVKDFDISIESISAFDFAKDYGSWKEKNPDKMAEEYFDGGNKFNGSFNMIVLGFADCYTIPNTNDCLDAVQGFINAGKPVLFTHDCSSFVNYRGTAPWGYDFNRMIRGQVGLDRYGVLNNWTLRVGTGYENGSTANFSSSNYPTILANLGNVNTNSDYLFNLAKNNAQINNKDVAYEPRSNKNKIVKEVEGFTYGCIIQNSGHDHDQNLKKVYPGLNGFSSGDTRTSTIEQINKGQITTYPFKVSERMTVATTHYQPYQLDLNEDEDKDGESDLIVWYTLAGNDSNNKWYTPSPKDVRNNYYIYTKGNITYSGVGHTTINGREEMKLYINTIVAAYKAALLPPSVTFKETAKPDAADKTVSYISYDVTSDAKNNGVVTNETEKVYFTPLDNNGLVKNVKLNETKILVRPLAVNGSLYKVYDANGIPINSGQDIKFDKCYVLKPGKTYYFEVPISELGENENKLEINVVAKARFVKDYKFSKATVYDYSPDGTSTYIIQKRGLFDLD